MSTSGGGEERWKAVLRKQKLANAKHWLEKIQQTDNLEAFVTREYDNLLRALEMTLREVDAFPLAFELIQKLYTIAIDYTDWERWAVYLNRALTQSKSLGLLSESARLLEHLSDLSFIAGEWDEAETLYLESCRVYKELGEMAKFANTLTRLAAAYVENGKVTEAIDVCQQAKQIGASTDSPLIVAHAELSLSYIYNRVQNYALGLIAAQKAQELYTQLGMKEWADKTGLNIANALQMLGKWDEAEQLYLELTERFEASGNFRSLCMAKNNLGIIAFEQQDYLRAESVWQEVLRLYSQMQQSTNAASIYNNLGKVYTALGEWQTAEEMLQQAIQMYDSVGNLYSWVNSRDNLVDLYEAQGKMDAARQILQETIARINQTNTHNLAHVTEFKETMQKRLDKLTSH